MEKLIIAFVILIFCTNIYATALDDFYEPQFQCNPNVLQYKNVKDKDDKPNPDRWSVITEFKTEELPKNSKIKDPHRRFKQHYIGKAVFICGAVLDGPERYEKIKEHDKRSVRDAIILMYLKNGIGYMTNLDYVSMNNGYNRDEDANGYFFVEMLGNRRVTACVSKLEDLLSGKTKIDVDKICSSELGTKDYKKDYEQTKTDIARLMGYWRKEYSLKQPNKTKEVKTK